MPSAPPNPTQAQAPAPASAPPSASALVLAATLGPASAAPLLQARGLTRIYLSGSQEILALDQVDLDIARGEFVVLLGPSDSGKSTLLNILAGLDVASSGTVCFAGHRLDGASDDELTTYRREHVGFVFQFYNLIPSLTARENVALVAGIASHPMLVDEALNQVDLLPRADHFPAQLSGGEQQRVAIARAIVKRPDLLLCDEPTGASAISVRNPRPRTGLGHPTEPDPPRPFRGPGRSCKAASDRGRRSQHSSGRPARGSRCG